MADSERTTTPPQRVAASSIPAPSVQRRRRLAIGARWPLIVGASILMGVIVASTTVNPAGRSTLSGTPPPPPPASRGYLVSVPELQERALRAAAGHPPYVEAVADLLADAEHFLDHEAQPIQPLIIDDDGGAFEDDGTAAYALALAYRIGGEGRFGRAASGILRAWMDGVSFAADTCADTGACHTSLIVSRLGASFVFAADLLEGTEYWTSADRSEFAGWLEQIILPAASERLNNWGDAGTLLRVVITDYVGDQAGFARALNHWRGLMDLVDPDGSIPEEARRGTLGLQYTQEALQYKVAVAEIAGRRGIDLWSYRGSRGGTLRAAMDTLARYWFDPASWPYDPAVLVPRPGPVWELAYAHWQEAAWVSIVTDRRPYGDIGHSALRWTTLTSGVPTTAVAGASPSPDVSPSPTPTATPPALDEPRLRIASVPSGGRIDVGLTWPVTPVVDGGATAIRIESSIDGAAFAAIASSIVAGHETVVRLPIGRPVRLRASVLDASGSPTVWADGPAVIIRIHDDTAPSVTLAGAWIAAAYPEYVRGTAASSSTAGAVATITVDAYAVMAIGPAGPTRGRFLISMDGDSGAQVDTYRSRFAPSTSLASASWASAGRHTLRLEVLASPAARPTVGFDAVVVIERAP